MSQTDLSIRPTPGAGVMKIAAYVPGRSGAPSRGQVHKLSSNEAPNGPCAAAIAAYQGQSGALHLYPEGSAAALRKSIAEIHGLDPDLIVCGSGSDELLGLMTRLYVEPGDETIVSERGFLMYRIHTLACGGRPVLAPEAGMRTDVDAILSRVTDRTRIVFLANPNNPTGTYLSRTEMDRLIAGLPKNVLLVIDAAYAEYVRKDDYSAGIELVAENQNVVMTRTFSKIHGLAALRIGWMYGPEHVIDAVNRIRGPFNMSSPALAAGIAAVQDVDFVAKEAAFNAEWRERVTDALNRIGLAVTPSEANFLLIHFPENETARSAGTADSFLTERGYILRGVKPYGLPHALRMSIGRAEANEGVIAALTRFMER